MSTPTTDDPTAPILSTAESMLASRLDVIRPLAHLIAERKRLQDQLDATEKPYGAAYTAAEAGGWTPAELKQMGAEPPAKRPAGRPKGSRTSSPRSSSASTDKP